MFDNAALDVTIGLVFIFLLYSLLATIVQEIIAQRLGVRQRFLVKIIRRMLEDGEPRRKTILGNYVCDSINGLKRYFCKQFTNERSLTRAFYEHPNIKYLGENRWSSKPSYIGAATFAETLIDLLRGNTYDGTNSQMLAIDNTLNGHASVDFDVDAETNKQLRRIWIDSHGDIEKFKDKLEIWFNRQMDRGTGWYKRHNQVMLLIIGFFIAWQFNVDTIAIGKILMNDEDARNDMVQLAVSKYKDYGRVIDTVFVKKDSNDNLLYTKKRSSIQQDDTMLQNTYARLKNDAGAVQMILGLGSNKQCDTIDTCRLAILKHLCSTIEMLEKNNVPDYKKAVKNAIDSSQNEMKKCVTCSTVYSEYQPNCSQKFIGCFITALAISLGAPFWFDLLNKIMAIRGSGKKPEERAEQKKNDNNVVPPSERVG